MPAGASVKQDPLDLIGPCQCDVMIASMFDFLVVMLACTLNERMQKKFDYIQEEVRVLREVIAALKAQRNHSCRIGNNPLGAGSDRQIPFH